MAFSRTIQADGSIGVTLMDGAGNLYIPGAPYGGTNLGFGTATVTTASVVGLPSIPAGATMAIINVASGAIWYRDDGTNPVTGVVGTGTGMLVTAQNTFAYSGALASFKMVASTANSVVNVSYYK